MPSKFRYQRHELPLGEYPQHLYTSRRGRRARGAEILSDPKGCLRQPCN